MQQLYQKTSRLGFTDSEHDNKNASKCKRFKNITNKILIMIVYDRRLVGKEEEQKGMDPILKNLIWVLCIAIFLFLVF